MHKQQLPRVMQVLREALQLELASLPTSLAQDKAELSDSMHPPGLRRGLALQFRTEKKLLLQDIIDSLR